MMQIILRAIETKEKKENGPGQTETQVATCVHYDRDQIWAQVDARFSPFGRPTQVCTQVHLYLLASPFNAVRCKRDIVTNVMSLWKLFLSRLWKWPRFHKVHSLNQDWPVSFKSRERDNLNSLLGLSLFTCSWTRSEMLENAGFMIWRTRWLTSDSNWRMKRLELKNRYYWIRVLCF